MGGLALASLAQRAGLKTVLCESHTRLGGCAGYFERGPYTFDCGATALMGLAPGEPIRNLLDRVGLEFQGIKTPEYRICLPDGDLALTDDALDWERKIQARYPDLGPNAARFWRIQATIGQRMFQAGSGLPRLPIRLFSDIVHNLEILGTKGSLYAGSSLFTVLDLMRLLGLHKDARFRALVGMLLQDTAQAGPETVPLANAAACLQAYRLGLSRPVGSMKALAEGLGSVFQHSGGELHRATIIDSIRSSPGASASKPIFVVRTRRGQELHTRHVAMNLPLDLCMKLLGKDLTDKNFHRKTTRSQAKWSAFMAWAAIDAGAIESHNALFHHVLRDFNQPIHDGNNVLISLSPKGDPGYGPGDVRIATMSTHVRPEEWENLSTEEYARKKTEYANRMRAALLQAFPGVDPSIRHIEFATPRSFSRYTRRTGGRVGGPPVSRSNSNLMATDTGIFGPGLWVVGDSVFPGQGTMAVVMCAMRVLERITGRAWYDDVRRPVD